MFSASRRVLNLDASITPHIEHEFAGHTGDITVLVALSDGRVASGSKDGTIRIWNLDTNTCDQILKESSIERINTLVELPGDRLASMGPTKNDTIYINHNDTIHIWNMRNGTCERKIVQPSSLYDRLALLNNGFLVSNTYSKILLWNVDSGSCEQEIPFGRGVSPGNMLALRDNRFVVVAPAGRYMGTILLFNGSDGRCERELSGHTSDIDVLVELKNSRLASGGVDGTIRVWNVNTGVCERVLSGHTGNIKVLVEQEDGRLASGCSHGEIRVWNVNTGVCNHVFNESGGSVKTLVDLGNGRLATEHSSFSGIGIMVWNANSAACEYTLKGHTNSLSIDALVKSRNGHLVSGSSFCNDGSTIMLFGGKPSDKTIRVWDVGLRPVLTEAERQELAQRAREERERNEREKIAKQEQERRELIRALSDNRNVDTRKQAVKSLRDLTTIRSIYEISGGRGVSRLITDEASKDFIREEGGIQPLLHLLSDANTEIRINAAQLLRNLITNNRGNENALVDMGGVSALKRLERTESSTEIKQVIQHIVTVLQRILDERFTQIFTQLIDREKSTTDLRRLNELSRELAALEPQAVALQSDNFFCARGQFYELCISKTSIEVQREQFRNKALEDYRCALKINPFLDVAAERVTYFEGQRKTAGQPSQLGVFSGGMSAADREEIAKIKDSMRAKKA